MCVCMRREKELATTFTSSFRLICSLQQAMLYCSCSQHPAEIPLCTIQWSVTLVFYRFRQLHSWYLLRLLSLAYMMRISCIPDKVFRDFHQCWQIFSCIPDKLFHHFDWYKKSPSYTRGNKTTLITWLNTCAPACVQGYWAMLVSSVGIICALLTLQSKCSLFRAHTVHYIVGKSNLPWM